MTARGAEIKRRRDALGMSVSALAREAGHMDRETVTKAETGSKGTQSRTYGQLETTLDRLEAAHAMEQVTVVVELPSGARATFVGEAARVAEAAAQFAELATQTVVTGVESIPAATPAPSRRKQGQPAGKMR